MTKSISNSSDLPYTMSYCLGEKAYPRMEAYAEDRAASDCTCLSKRESKDSISMRFISVSKKGDFRSLKLRISNWPFSASEQVVLHWLRSPRMEGDGQQWVMTAVFRRTSGELVEVDVPWGMVASLQLGNIYQYGSATDATIPMDRLIIRFPDNVEFVLQRAGDALSKSYYPLHTHDNLNEMCLRLYWGRNLFIVPCLEVIRSFFCPNRIFAEAILTPEGLVGLVKTHVTGTVLDMRYSDRVPYSLMRAKYLVALTAQILYQESWNESWRQVWHGWKRRGNGNPNGEYAPLFCEPPALAGAKWNVLARKHGNVTFIYRILGTESFTEFPFTEILYSHPNSKIPDKLDFGGPTHVITRVRPNEAVARRDLNAPTKPTQPTLVGVETANHLDLSNTKIKEIGIKARMNSGNSGPIVTEVVSTSGPQPVSFYEEAGTGTIRAGEFIPLPEISTLQLTSSMRPFFRAIEHIKFFEGFSIGYVIAKVPSSSAISGVLGGDCRLYVLVEVRWRQYASYILEIDGPDGHSMSTVIFSTKNHPMAPSAVARTLLNNHVTPQGAWNCHSIESYINGQVSFARHRGSDASAWGERLGVKARHVMFAM